MIILTTGETTGTTTEETTEATTTTITTDRNSGDEITAAPFVEITATGKTDAQEGETTQQQPEPLICD